MIRATAAHPQLDASAVWEIELALERERDALSPARAAAWGMILRAKQPRATSDYEGSWYRERSRVRLADVSFNSHRVVANLLRPRSTVQQPLRTQYKY